LLKNVGCAVCFKRPHFHFSEALATELRLTTQRLLRDERVRPDGASVNLVVNQVRELEHVDVAHGRWLLELFTGHAVAEWRLARAGKPSCGKQCLDLGFARAVEDRGAKPDTLLHAQTDTPDLLVVELKQLTQCGSA